MTTEPPYISEKSENDVVVDNLERGYVRMPSVEDTVANTAEGQSTKDLVETITPSVRDTTMENTKSMEFVYISSAASTYDLTDGHAEDDV
ncbi:hypothetical protein LIER_33401 [Lithospermum erythrorhizon]|uniref:Uncharacterized protein n=1 Tax=Lithospermum erythrorhizon TaxID=34254 RepID=A0AAV3RYC2_LITER